jgi:hypothetical protein
MLCYLLATPPGQRQRWPSALNVIDLCDLLSEVYLYGRRDSAGHSTAAVTAVTAAGEPQASAGCSLICWKELGASQS